MLRHGAPRPDLAILLDVDAETAARRKPGDQAMHILTAMERLYAQRADEAGIVRVDARRAPSRVREELERLVDGLVDERRGRAAAESR